MMDQTEVHITVHMCPGKIHVRPLCLMERKKGKKKLLFEIERKEIKKLKVLKNY